MENGFREVYRPKNLNEFHLTTDIAALKRHLNKPKHSHVFFFSGSKGTGKTSLARIIGQYLNCEHPEDTNPCGRCDHCVNSSLYIKEENMADKTGIDETRAIISEIMAKPLDDSRRVLILDEAQRLSKDSQACWLKALENTPSHLYVFICTMEPEKFVGALIDRCTRFNFEKLNTVQSVELLESICKKEKISPSKDILTQIAKDIGGCPRQLLTALEEYVDKGKYSIPEEAQEEARLGPVIYGILKSEPWANILNKIWPLLDGVKSPEQIRVSIVTYLSKMLESPIEGVTAAGVKVMMFIAALEEPVVEPAIKTWFLLRLFTAWKAIRVWKPET